MGRDGSDQASQGSSAATDGARRQVRHGTSYPPRLLICQLAFPVGMLAFLMLVDSLLMRMTGG